MYRRALWGTTILTPYHIHDMPDIHSTLCLVDCQVIAKVTKALARAALVEAKAAAMWLPQEYQPDSLVNKWILFLHNN